MEKQHGRPVFDWLRHFRLLLWNRRTEFAVTWQEARTQHPLPSLCFRADQKKKQDGRPASDWLPHFYTPVLRRDLLLYGDPRPGLRPPVFRIVLLHALTYWAEILHITLFSMYYRSSSSVVTLCQLLKELCPFWNIEYWKYAVFRIFLLHALTIWAETLHITLF